MLVVVGSLNVLKLTKQPIFDIGNHFKAFGDLDSIVGHNQCWLDIDSFNAWRSRLSL
jgi:hypothetical protein